MRRRKIDQIGTIRIIRDTEWQQYICSPVGAKNDDSAYFTTDLDDARATAAAMHNRRLQMFTAPEYADAVNSTHDAKACRHGHPGCALSEGGACSDELLAVYEDNQARKNALAVLKPRCPDCGELGERAGHMGCQYPENHP